MSEVTSEVHPLVASGRMMCFDEFNDVVGVSRRYSESERFKV